MKKKNLFAFVLAILMFVAPICLAGCSLSDLFGENKNVEGIMLHTAFKTEYDVGEALDVTNGKIQYTNENGKKTIVAIQEDMISGFNTATEGQRGMIVTYKDCTIVVDYTVYKIYDIEIGALYYCNPSEMIAAQNAIQGTNYDPNLYYDYVSFSSSNSAAFSYSNITPNHITDNGGFASQQYISCTSKIENHKKIYSFTTATGASIEIYATSETTIHFKGNSPAENVMNFEMDLVKYINK